MSRKRSVGSSSSSAGAPGKDPENDYSKAWLTPNKKAKTEIVDTASVKVWFNECVNPNNNVASGKWLMFVQPPNKVENQAIKDIVHSVSLGEVVKTSKSNQYFTIVKLFNQGVHTIKAIQALSIPVNNEVGKEEQFKNFCIQNPIVLEISSSIVPGLQQHHPFHTRP